ncbi:MAG: DUF4910 domain-containing protein [Hyphomicrobium sp.]
MSVGDEFLIGRPTSRPLSALPSVSSVTGTELYELASRFYPICRSITGRGVRETLRLISDHIDIDVHEVATGTQVFDWTVPREWHIRDAYIKDRTGRRIVDFGVSNLHVMNYSAPVHATMGLAELLPHLHSLPDKPDLIPYRTSYYQETWGFCLAHSQLEALEDGDYEVYIDSSLVDGSLTYGEFLHRGATDREFVLSAHICHPSLANDNCSGLALLTLLAEWISKYHTRLSYRFVFAPGTIGAVTWLARNEARTPNIEHGLIVSCVGDGGGPNYKRSRRGDAVIDHAMEHVLSNSGLTARIVDFAPYGYDERQYCSPGFDLPFGLFQRSQWGAFREYHTSADNLDLIAPEHLKTSLDVIVSAIEIAEKNCTLRNRLPKCEPQLGKRGLFGPMEGNKASAASNMAMLWVLNLSDGHHSLLDIARRANLPFSEVSGAADRLLEHGLLSGKTLK